MIVKLHALLGKAEKSQQSLWQQHLQEKKVKPGTAARCSTYDSDWWEGKKKPTVALYLDELPG